jgi:histidinol phosphatase-like enzyme (inositol monophosphatase family)
MEHSDLTARLDFAIGAARAAGSIAMEHFQAKMSIEMKSDDSPVTVADRRAEQELRRMIAASYPDDGVLGEEFGERAGSSGWRWILDPIDGTQSFIRGVPLFGVLIGVEKNDEAVLGVAYMPALEEMVYAAKGHGCWWRPAGSPAQAPPLSAHVSGIAKLADGVILTTSFDYWAQRGKAPLYAQLAAAGKTRGWSDCYAHILVATGRAEAAVEPVMSVWDSAPFLPILHEAGGTYTDWQGRPTISATDIFSSNGKVFDEILQLLREN